MPQDGPRSVVYRSFFSCEDPKGVVECKTNRKSKNNLHKLEDKVDRLKKPRNLSRSSSLNGDRNNSTSKGPTDLESHSSSSFQLMQISRGAERLNQVIDTWSKEISFERPSKDIAKDLLKGALDLKESLAMLGKLQEASQVMAKLKKKQKDKGGGGGGKLDAAGIERTTSDRFGYANHRALEFENPRFSVDGSTRDCFEELREVIKESFARQNLLPKSYNNEERPYSDRPKSELLLVPSSPDLLPKTFKEEKGYFDKTKSEFSWDPSYKIQMPKVSKEEKMKSDFSQDLPSTSSSQSSHFFSYEFESSDSSISKSIEMKPKASNVIAKLMGLEDASPKRLQSYQQKYYGKEKSLDQGRLTFDVDLPKARRPPPFTVQKVDPHPRTLEELTETVQFKGLVSSSSPSRAEHHSDVSAWRKGFASDAPPIVIIKPLHVSDFPNEGLHRPNHEDLDTEEMLRRKHRLPPRSNNDREGAVKVIESHRKARAEKSPGRRPVQERGGKDLGDAVVRKDDKSARRLEKSSSATIIKGSAQVKPKIQKKDAAEKTVSKVQKAVPDRRKRIEVETEKSRDASKSLQPNKVTSSNPRKPEREPNFSRVRVSQEKGSISDSAAECIATSHRSSFQKKNSKKEKQISEPSSILVGCEIKSDNIPVESVSLSVPDVTAQMFIPLEPISCDEDKDISGNLADCRQSGSYIGDSSMLLLPSRKDKTNEGANNHISYGVPEKKRYGRNNTIRNFLLDSRSFLNRADELFDIYSCEPTHSYTNSWLDYGTADNKVLLECAKELLENKSLHCAVAASRMSNSFVKGSKICISLDQLVNEICDGIEYLRSYYKLADKELVVHKLHTVLQKDMWGKGVVNGSWDLGWSGGFTQDEIDQVVVDIEQTILSGVIEDLLRDVAV